MGVCRCGKGGISVERLTERKVGQSYPLKDKAASKVGLFTDYDGFYTYFEAVNRLGAIEDILGEDYDLERLKEAVEKQAEYEQFMEKWKQVAEIAGAVKKVGAERAAELVEADLDGRCVPIVRCRECKHWEDWGACGHTDNGFDSPPMGPDDFCSKGERSTD